MSSSTSSDFENAECFYGGFSNATPWPMQPLIYYTHVPSRDKQRGRERKRNPNCFVKAFRWYTQEHHPKRADSMSTNAPEIKGFAMWLDQKYHEFIQENKSERTRYTMKKTSTFEIEKTSNNFPYESCGAKKFKRPKSPRKRHRKLTNSKGNTPLRSNKSFEILLYPKNTVSRTASECCQRGFSCCTCCPPRLGKSKHKSQSLTSVFLEKEVYQIPYDTIDNVNKRDDRENEVKKIIATIVDQTRHAKDPLASTCMSSKGLRTGQSRKSTSCQCVEENNVKFDAYSQWPSSRVKTNMIETQKPKWPQNNAWQQVPQNPMPAAAYPLFMRIICPDKLKES